MPLPFRRALEYAGSARSLKRLTKPCLPSMRDVSVLEINLSNLDHNMRVLRSIVGPQVGLCPIVKADAYGLGAPRIAKRLAYDGADLLAVYTADQAAELFRAAIGCRILVLMPIRDIARVDELYRGLISDRLQLTVHDMDHVSDLIAITERYGVTIAVHLEVDTGMSRGGCSLDDAPAILKRISLNRRLQLVGIFTHFASADSDPQFTDEQMVNFDALLATHASLIPKDCRIHVASSFAMIRHKRYHKTMVRVGLGWAGYGLECLNGGEIISQAQQLRPILTWKSRLVQIKRITAGTPVGYGSTWRAKRTSLIGLIPVGYADGYPIAFGTRDGTVAGAPVAIVPDGEPTGYAPVIGAVNMDQITVDLTDIGAVEVGAPVELISPDTSAPNHLPALARLANTIPHEMLCRLNSRLKRDYVAPVASHDEAMKAPAPAMAG
jgi:alanine racemase